MPLKYLAMSLIINTLLNFDSYRVGIVNGSRTIKLPVASDANRNKGNNKLPNSEQSYKGKVKTHNYINRQNQSTTGKL